MPRVVNNIDFDFDFKILTALKGWVGHAPQGRGALHNNYRLCALHIIILTLNDYIIPKMTTENSQNDNFFVNLRKFGWAYREKHVF
jgi:hypothetical protein